MTDISTNVSPTNHFQTWDLILFRHQFRRYVEHLSVRSAVFTMEFWMFWKFLPMNVADSIVTAINIRQIIECFSPFSETFEILLSFSNLIIHPIHEWCWFYWQFQFCFIVSSDELLRPCLFLRIDIRSPRSVTRCFLVHNGLRGSVVKSFLVRETGSNFSCRSARSFIRSPRSLVCLNISFPLLGRPSTVVIPLWAACWREAFHKLFMVTVIRSFQSVYADIRSLRSLVFLSIWTPGILTSITSFHRAYWSRGWYVRRCPCNKIHHWSRFCCDSFFTWILLRSFRHCIRANCRTEMADVQQIQQMIPLITCEN